MNCSQYEQLVALYVEGDLDGAERVGVVMHLERCSSCRDLAEELGESQSVFKTLRNSSVNSTALANVRQRVLNEVGDLEPAPAWVIAIHRLFLAGLRRKTAIAGIAMAALVSGGVLLEQPRTVVVQPGNPPVEAARIDVPAVEAVPDAKRSAVSTPSSVRTVHRIAVTPTEAPAVESTEEPAPQQTQIAQIPMKFVTDDPDIIIYWLPSDKGD
jgi:anti-sigma factor RsiW